jgi:hypothetical protein
VGTRALSGILQCWLALAVLSCPAPALAATSSARPKPISSYGPISVGHPSAGFLINGARMPAGDDWVLTAPNHVYATTETIEQLRHCASRVRAEHPGSAPVRLGSLSGKGGGRIPPHDSHRTGRDADVYFFRQPDAKWNAAATREDIDLARTWALLRCFVTDCDVDFVLIDRVVEGWLEDYALGAGEPGAWIHSVFHDAEDANHDREKQAVVREAPGHVAHMHVRFVSPAARRLGVELYDRLVGEGYVAAPRRALRHRVASGDTLGGIARRYRTRVSTLRELNGLKSTRIQAGQWLVIAPEVALRGARDAIRIPSRRRPPSS